MGNKVGEAIKETLRIRGITQVKLANMLDKSQSQMTKYLSGENQMGINIVIDIANLLNMTLDELVGRTPPQTSDITNQLNEPHTEYKKKPKQSEIDKLRQDITSLQSDIKEIKEILQIKKE